MHQSSFFLCYALRSWLFVPIYKRLHLSFSCIWKLCHCKGVALITAYSEPLEINGRLLTLIQYHGMDCQVPMKQNPFTAYSFDDICVIVYIKQLSKTGSV